MNILIVNTFDIKGGAAKAAYRLHKSLLSQGIDCQMLVQNKISDDFTVIETFSYLKKEFYKIRKILDGIPVLLYKKRINLLFSPSWLPFSNVVNDINRINPDIVHLHWINNGMIKVEDLAKIKAPIVWTLHDNWAFTGGCHIVWDCEKYKINCGACPRLGSDKENDLSKKIFKRKVKTFTKKNNMTIVAVSHWLMNCAKESILLKDKKIFNIPNSIDINIFKSFDKDISRELWNLPKDKKLILFGAMNATENLNKGFKELSEALPKLKDKNIEFVVFGCSKPKRSQNFDFKTHYLGELNDEVSLVTIYNAVDVMVVPSLQEAFGQTASESLACGTPVVAFAHTGLLDNIEHQQTGYLAKSFDVDDLANGINWVLNAPNYNELCRNARNKVLKQFDSKIVVQQYIKLYKSILKK